MGPRPLSCVALNPSCEPRRYQLLGFEEIGVEIESPFGTADNDIDLDAIVRDICLDMQAR